MQEVSENTAGKFIHSYSWILIIVAFFPAPRFSLPQFTQQSSLSSSPWMDHCTALCFINTLAPLFLYFLCLIVGEVSTLTFCTAQSSVSTSKSLKNPKIMSAQSGYLKMAFLQHSPSFHPSKKLWSPLLPLGFHVFLAWQGPESRMLFIILRQGKHNVL